MLSLLLAAVVLAAPPDPPTAFVGATVWPGGGAEPIPDAALVVRAGRVTDLFARGDRDLPEGTRVVDLTGHYVVPGLINAHGHVGMADGLETGPEVHSEANVRRQLRLYAHYGITTVVSLGDEPPQAFAVRDAMDPARPGMARLVLSGPVVESHEPEAARAEVRERVEDGAD
jgi:cytosine/adenosine deaminase-related metal-dependent hydrolase